MKIELEIDEKIIDEAAKKELEGLRIYGANTCPIHSTVIILARKGNTAVDLRCALEACDEMKAKLIDQAKGFGFVYGLPDL